MGAGIEEVNKKCDVLIVEDSEDMRWAMANVLEMAGFTVDAVTTGGQAIERLKEAPEIELVILNFLLPDKSGLTVLKQLKSNGCKAAVIATSALKDMGDSFMKAGAFAFMEKPFDIRELVRLCKEALKENSALVEATRA